MKVIHVPFTFHPDPVGGTEVYVESLSRAQRELGVTATIAAPGLRFATYTCRGSYVFRLPVPDSVPDIRELYGLGSETAREAFSRVLDEEAPDIVHLHAFTRGVSLRLVREASRRRIPVVFSYHTPTVSCQRGTLLRWGTDVCDGVLDVTTCSQCTLLGLGLSGSASRLVGAIPPSIGARLGWTLGSGSAGTAIRMSELMTLRHDSFRALMDESAHVIAHCDWVKALLVRNGVLPGKVTVSRQGVQVRNVPPSPEGRPRASEALKVMFGGRLDPTKGIHVLVEAIRRAPDLRVELSLYTLNADGQRSEYLNRLEGLAGGDARIVFRPSVQAEDVVGLMRQHDLVAVPSMVLETGPLVAMEAFAAGVPVIGSDLGGIAELVRHNVDGVLVPAGVAEEWTRVLRQLAEEPAQLDRLRQGIRPPRSSEDCAREVAAVYAQVLAAQGRRVA